MSADDVAACDRGDRARSGSAAWAVENAVTMPIPAGQWGRRPRRFRFRPTDPHTRNILHHLVSRTRPCCEHGSEALVHPAESCRMLPRVDERSDGWRASGLHVSNIHDHVHLLGRVATDPPGRIAANVTKPAAPTKPTTRKSSQNERRPTTKRSRGVHQFVHRQVRRRWRVGGRSDRRQFRDPDAPNSVKLRDDRGSGRARRGTIDGSNGMPAETPGGSPSTEIVEETVETNTSGCVTTRRLTET